MAGEIKVKQVRSMASVPRNQRRILQGLGLRKIGQERVHKDNNCIRGMVNKISHLVTYELKK